jgi:hypothetical protein
MNTARNDITGRVIKTNPTTSTYAENWEKIFAKKTAYEWLKITGREIIDPDGWRRNDGVTMDTPITWSDFQGRLCESTIVL